MAVSIDKGVKDRNRFKYGNQIPVGRYSFAESHRSGRGKVQLGSGSRWSITWEGAIRELVSRKNSQKRLCITVNNLYG